MPAPVKLSLLERTKVQAEVLVPLVHALEEELGKERAHQVVREAIGGQVREAARRHAKPGDVRGTVESLHRLSAAGDAHELDELEGPDDEVNVNITRCEYASFFRDLGEPELGFLLVCMLDYDLAEGIDGLSLTRSQTIMQGGSHCDFRWRIDEERG